MPDSKKGKSPKKTENATKKASKDITNVSSNDYPLPVEESSLGIPIFPEIPALQKGLDELSQKLTFLEQSHIELRSEVLLAQKRAEGAERRAVDAEIAVKALEKSTHSVQYMPLEDLDDNSPIPADDYQALGEQQLQSELEKEIELLFNQNDEGLQGFEKPKTPRKDN